MNAIKKAEHALLLLYAGRGGRGAYRGGHVARTASDRESGAKPASPAPSPAVAEGAST